MWKIDVGFKVLFCVNKSLGGREIKLKCKVIGQPMKWKAPSNRVRRNACVVKRESSWVLMDRRRFEQTIERWRCCGRWSLVGRCMTKSEAVQGSRHFRTMKQRNKMWKESSSFSSARINPTDIIWTLDWGANLGKQEPNIAEFGRLNTILRRFVCFFSILTIHLRIRRLRFVVWFKVTSMHLWNGCSKCSLNVWVSLNWFSLNYFRHTSN